ncbi:TPA: hypothetical protein ACH3X2_004813 [Trebouxia sp. C0005]
MQSTLTGTVASHDCTMDSLDDLDRLLSNSADFTEFVTAPDLPSVYSQPKDVQNENTAGRRGTLRPDDTPDPTLQGRKQRALDKSREAQKRFRQRQKARLDTIQLQLDETTKQLRDLHVQQQHLQTRNILLEKIAQLSKEQTTDDYLAWQHKQAALDFTCGHTEATPQGFTLTLTIFGHAESKECRSVSNMSLSELAALWTEYMRKLGKCLLSIQQDERAGARPLLNLWVAEAIALICCVRVYNPEFLKAIDSAAMNGSAAVRPSHLLLIQHLELLEFTDAQIQDVLYLRRIVAARAHDLEKQRHEATARMLSQASMKQHPSDHLAESKASSQELKLIGMEEYKLHGIATDALANGICSSIQNAMALVHMYPFLPDALEYLELVAEQQGVKDAPVDPPETISQADWDTLLAYCTHITATDYFEHVPLRGFTGYAAAPSKRTAPAATPHTSSSHAVASVNPHSSGNHFHSSPSQAGASANQHSPNFHTPSPGHRTVRFSPEPIFRQASFPNSLGHSVRQSFSQSPSHSHSPEPIVAPISHSPAHVQQAQTHYRHLFDSETRSQATQSPSQAMQSHQMSRQASRQGSSQIREGSLSLQTPSWMVQGQAQQCTQLQTGQDSNLGFPVFQSSQEQARGRSLLQDQTLRHMKPNLMQHPGPDQTPLYMTDGVNQAQISGHVTAVLDHQMPHYMMSGLDREQSVTQAPSTSVTGYNQGVQGRPQHGQTHMPSWTRHNLASAYAVPPEQARHLNQHMSQTSSPVTPRVLYPTAAMRSQQLSSVQAPAANVVQAPLAPFLNEQLKRMVAQGGPSARRGF